MKKFFKSLLATILVVVAVASFSVSAMAEEMPLVAGATSRENAESASADVARANALVGSYYYEGNLTQGKTLTPVSITSSAKTIRYCVNGNGGNVILHLQNRVSGNSKRFTATGDGSWGSITYVGSLEAGIWDVTVAFVSGGGHNTVYMNFYA